jgi:RNAse (barnase) inhibitor barstar
MNGFYLFDKEMSISHADSITARLDGNACRSLRDLFVGIAEQFRFPDYFSHNLDSLEELLNDLSWLEYRHFIIIITNYDALLSEENPQRKEALLQILNDVAMQWGQVPNFEGEDNYRHKSDFRIYMENTPTVIIHLDREGITYH